MTQRKDMTEAYEAALKLPKQGESDCLARTAALERAHSLRKFEIENYWKRATYFWAFQAIAFAVLGFTVKDGGAPEPVSLLQIPAALGALSALVGYLSAKGSKYWQENWEAHVDMLEGSIEGCLTQTIWSDGKTSYSVSRVNQTFLLLLTLSWTSLMVVASLDSLQHLLLSWDPIIALLALLAAMFFLAFHTRQNLTGYYTDQNSWFVDKKRQKDRQWRFNWHFKSYDKEGRQILLRHTKAKDSEAPE